MSADPRKEITPETAAVLHRTMTAVVDNLNRISAMSGVLAADLSNRIGEDPDQVTIACATSALLLARLIVSNHPRTMENGHVDEEGVRTVAMAYLNLVLSQYAFDRVQ